MDSQSIAQASANKGKGIKRKKNVSENAGKGNIQLMLSNLPSKKKEVSVYLIFYYSMQNLKKY